VVASAAIWKRRRMERRMGSRSRQEKAHHRARCCG
jgi:hypothetical protein